MNDNKVSEGIGYFKENVDRLQQLDRTISSSKNILGEDLWDRLIKFCQNFYYLSSECRLVKWLGGSGEEVLGSEFFFNYKGSGYQYFKKLNLEGEKHILGLSDNMSALLSVILDIKSLRENQNQVSEERELQKISEIKTKIEDSLPKAAKNFEDIVKVLWPDVDLISYKDDLSRLLMTPKGSKKSIILEMIKDLDAKDLTIREYSNNLKTEKEVKEVREEVKGLKGKLGTESSEVFSSEYKKIRDEIKSDISWFSGLLRVKIFLLRAITYTIPILLLTFHFCEFFGQKSIVPSAASKNCRPCSWFVGDVKPVELAQVKQSKQENSRNKSVEVNRDKLGGQKNSDPYLYLHLALITILALSFQQLRTAIKELSIKKSLHEIYRHRVLVSETFLKMYSILDDKDAKNEVIKSATKSLFENEPSIYESGTKTLPPNIFDIKNIVGR